MCWRSEELAVLTCVQTLSHCSCINEVAAAQAASDVGVYVPEFNLPGQHLWLLQEKDNEVTVMVNLGFNLTTSGIY